MKKRVHEQVWPTLLIAALGFALLAVMLPDWARAEVLGFGVVFAALVVMLDDDVRDALRRSLDSGLRRNDTKSNPAKAPVSRRAAT